MRLRMWTCGVVLVWGCSVPEEEFPDELAETYCDRVWTCDQDAAMDIYGSVGDCEDFWSTATEAWVDVADFLGDDYVPEEGDDCIRAVRWTSCDEIEDLDLSETCEEVLD